MPRYIDAEKIGYCCNPECEGKCDKCRKDDRIVSEESIEQIPTADVQEVKHGKWMHKQQHDYRDNWYQCDVCSAYSSSRTPYCSNCGARMDGDER